MGRVLGWAVFADPRKCNFAKRRYFYGPPCIRRALKRKGKIAKCRLIAERTIPSIPLSPPIPLLRILRALSSLTSLRILRSLFYASSASFVLATSLSLSLVRVGSSLLRRSSSLVRCILFPSSSAFCGFPGVSAGFFSIGVGGTCF